MSETELRDLADDIEKNGLREPVAVYSGELLDGRNRLDALALLGQEICGTGWLVSDIYTQVGHDGPFDAVAYVISKNIYRRHLTADQRDKLAVDLLKVNQQRNRHLAKLVGRDHKTIATVRAEGEARGEIPHVETRTDSKGRKQPAHKAAKPEPEPAPTSASPAPPSPASTPAPATRVGHRLERFQNSLASLSVLAEGLRDLTLPPNLTGDMAAVARDQVKEAAKNLHQLEAKLAAVAKGDRAQDVAAVACHAAAMLADGLPAAFIRHEAKP